MAQPTRIRMTLDEFLQLPETMLPTQLIDGEVIQMGAPELDHQDIVGDTFVLLKQLEKTVGGKTYVAPVDVVMDAENVPQPDVLWVVPESQCVPEGTKRLRGAPDLIVEVLSPGTARLDKSTKFLLYERHGVREYWIADPKHRQLEVWTLVNGEYMQQGVYRPDETFVSVVLGGTAIAVKALFGG